MVEAWLPTRYSPALCGTEEFPSHASWLLPLADLVWRTPGGAALTLDADQRWLIRHILEVYPEGHPKAGELRYRQVLVSVSRQVGKSILGALLGLYGLVRSSGSLVIGIASSAVQARIIYARLLKVIKGNAELASRFSRLTDTRGLEGLNGSRYEIKPAKSAAVQGLDLDVGLVDEVHLVPEELWADMVNGLGSRPNGIVIGFTTAGDDESSLLLSLYELIEAGTGERFGFFIWESPELPGGKLPEDEATLREYLTQASPAIAVGRMDLETVLEDIAGMPVPDVIRYRLNRFVASVNEFMPLKSWAACAGALTAPERVVFSIDVTPDWTAGTITANWKSETVLYSQVVASVVRPRPDELVSLCVKLSNHHPVLYVGDGYTLRKSVLEPLKNRGLPVQAASLADVTAASAMVFSKIMQKKFVHAGDPLLTIQMPSARRKNYGESWRVSRKSGTEIDGVMSTVIGSYFAEIYQEVGTQLF